jgi:plasmid stabilization system protein ParE
LNRARFHPEAAAEIAAAARYYESEAEGLGSDFLDLVESGCSRLERFPDLGRPFGSRLRRLVLPRFPYSIIYWVGNESLTIVAVANHYRRPGYWRDRL